MDDTIITLLWCALTALVTGSIAFRLGVRAKDRRWRSALAYFDQHGLAISRRRRNGGREAAERRQAS